MEKFLLTSKILYDEDILHKTQEIMKLRLQLKNYQPARNFESESQWENVLNSALEELWGFLQSKINNDNDDMSSIKLNYNGCPIFGGHKIRNQLGKTLYDISKNHNWSEFKSYEIIYNITCVVDSLVKSDHGEYLTNMMPLQKCFFLYHSIENILGNGFDGGILEGIPRFLCARCRKRTDYITKNSTLCFDCSCVADKIRHITKVIADN